MNRFGDVLRNLGSVLNPQVAQEIGAEERLQQQQAGQIGMMGLQKRIEMESPEYKARVEALKNEKLFREEVAGAEGDMTRIATAAVKYGKPELAVNLYNQQESRVARIEQAKMDGARKLTELEFRLADRALDRDSRERMTAMADETRRTIASGNQQIAREMQELRRLQITMGTKAEAPKAPSGYRWADEKQTVLEPIPGGPATVQSPEAAAKTELLVNGIKDVERYKELVLKDGKPDRQIIVGMATPGMAGVPGTNSRLAYSYIYNAIEAKLRAESGAAVPETEVTRMAKRFVPSPLDNDETIKSKVDRLEEFLGGSLGRVKGQPGAGTQKPSVLPKIASDDDYDKLPSGAEFIDPEGKKRKKP